MLKRYFSAVLVFAVLLATLAPSSARASLGAPLTELNSFWQAQDAYLDLLVKTETAQKDLLSTVDQQASGVERYWQSVFERELYARLKEQGDKFDWAALKTRMAEVNSASPFDPARFRREEGVRDGLRATAAAIVDGKPNAGGEYALLTAAFPKLADDTLAGRLAVAKARGEYLALVSLPPREQVKAEVLDRYLKRPAPAAAPPAVETVKIDAAKQQLSDLYPQLAKAAVALSGERSRLADLAAVRQQVKEDGSLVTFRFYAEVSDGTARLMAASALSSEPKQIWTGKAYAKNDGIFLPVGAFAALGYAISGESQVQIVTPARRLVAQVTMNLSPCPAAWDYCALHTKDGPLAPVSLVGATVRSDGGKSVVEFPSVTAARVPHSEIAAYAESHHLEIAGVVGDQDTDGLIPVLTGGDGSTSWSVAAPLALPTYWVGESEYEKLAQVTAFWGPDGGRLLRQAMARTGMLNESFVETYPEAVASGLSTDQVLRVLAWAKDDAVTFVRSYGANSFRYGLAFVESGIAYEQQAVAETLKAVNGHYQLYSLRDYADRVKGNLVSYLAQGGNSDLVRDLLAAAPAGTVLDRETIKSWTLTAIAKTPDPELSNSLFDKRTPDEKRAAARAIVADSKAVAFIMYRYAGDPRRFYTYGFRDPQGNTLFVDRPIKDREGQVLPDYDTFSVLDAGYDSSGNVQKAQPGGFYVRKRDPDKKSYEDVSILMIGSGSSATVVHLVIGSTDVTVNGESRQMPAPAVLDGGSTLVPLRWIGETLGAQIGWEGAEQKVTYRLGDRTVVLRIGQNEALVNGQAVALANAPSLRDGLTYVPLRFVGEALGATVTYDAADRSVTISVSQ